MRPRYHLGPIARGSLKTLLVYAMRLLIQLTLLLVLARYLGPANFGEFAGLAAMAIALSSLSTFGVGYLVLGQSAKDPERGRMLLREAVPATVLSAMVLGPLYFWLCRAVLGSEASALVLALIGVSDLLLVPLLTLISHRVQGLGKVARSQMIGATPIALRLIGLVICLILAPNAGLGTYAVVYTSGALTALILALAMTWQDTSGFWQPLQPGVATLRSGSGYALMNFMAANPTEIDKALALKFLDSEEAGLYSLASRGMAVVALPVIAMVVSAQPRIFREADSNYQSLPPLIRRLLLVSLVYGFFAAGLLYSLAPPFLQFVLGDRYRDIGEVVALIALIAPFMALRFAAGGVLVALGRPVRRAINEGVSLLLMIGLALALAPPHGTHGLVGAVLGGEAAMALLGCIAVLRHSNTRRGEMRVPDADPPRVEDR